MIFRSIFFSCVTFIFNVFFHSYLFLNDDMFFSVWFFSYLRLMFFLNWNKFSFFELKFSSFFIMCWISRSTDVKNRFECKFDSICIIVIDNSQNICDKIKKKKLNRWWIMIFQIFVLWWFYTTIHRVFFFTFFVVYESIFETKLHITRQSLISLFFHMTSFTNWTRHFSWKQTNWILTKKNDWINFLMISSISKTFDHKVWMQYHAERNSFSNFFMLIDTVMKISLFQYVISIFISEFFLKHIKICWQNILSTMIFDMWFNSDS